MSVISYFETIYPTDINGKKHMCYLVIQNVYIFQPENSYKTQPGKYDDYTRSVKELLFFTAELSEGQKAISEFFDDKIKSVMASNLHIGNLKRLA